MHAEHDKTWGNCNKCTNKLCSLHCCCSFTGRDSSATFFDLNEPTVPLCAECAAEATGNGHKVVQVSLKGFDCRLPGRRS